MPISYRLSCSLKPKATFFLRIRAETDHYCNVVRGHAAGTTCSAADVWCGEARAPSGAVGLPARSWPTPPPHAAVARRSSAVSRVLSRPPFARASLRGRSSNTWYRQITAVGTCAIITAHVALWFYELEIGAMRTRKKYSLTVFSFCISYQVLYVFLLVLADGITSKILDDETGRIFL